MKRPVLVRLRDMLRAIEAVQEMVGQVGFANYQSDLKLRLAVERAVEIISEASRHVPEGAKASYSAVPWAEIAAIGNKLRHEYQRIDDMIMFKIATRSLLELKPVVEELIEKG